MKSSSDRRQKGGSKAMIFSPKIREKVPATIRMIDSHCTNNEIRAAIGLGKGTISKIRKLYREGKIGAATVLHAGGISLPLL